MMARMTALSKIWQDRDVSIAAKERMLEVLVSQQKEAKETCCFQDVVLEK